MKYRTTNKENTEGAEDYETDENIEKIGQEDLETVIRLAKSTGLNLYHQNYLNTG